MNIIKDIINMALSETGNKHAELCIGTVTKRNADDLKPFITDDLLGSERYIDTNTIRHIIKNHGSPKTETKRGQIAITLDDIEAIPNILRSYNKVKYIGKNRMKQDTFEYHAKIDGTYVILEAVRVRKLGNRVYIQSMYKLKNKAT